MKQLVLLLFCLFALSPAFAQKKTTQAPAPAPPPTNNGVADQFYDALSWRNIGPFRGGRSAAVTGVPGKPNFFYFGATGGGIWRTQDGGRTWESISDGYFGGSIGAIEVAPSDPNVLYVGGGEVTVRGNVSYGSGMWKSDDAGRTWKNIGLKDSRHIPRLQIHPTNADVVYAAVLGDLFKSSEERGVYRTRDGGKTWQRVLFVNNDVGAVDLCMDPTNPRILYASFWRVRRTPWSLSSGGEGSSLWKSTDGGDTWSEISRNDGLPKDTLGIIGVSVSAVKPDRVYAIVESQTGGVFRSDDGGRKWTKVNEDRNLRQRAWYYTRIYADTKDEDVVYVMNVAYHKSKDGGKTFSGKYAPHGDHHALWIAPEDPKRMIIGDDGGAQISYDGGETWSTYHNQPTAQFYRVTTDNHFPFRIYAAQQDNSCIRINSRSDGGAITERDWESTAGGESGHVAVDPLNNDIVYGGEYHGFLSRVDHQRKTSRVINVWPEDNMGHGAEDAKYRFQWNFPLFFSPHDPKKLYACSNVLHLTTDEGQTWTNISPDLTTNDKSKQKSSGGPITQDNTSVEYYCTIFAAAESPRVAGVIWTGSDDGLVHVTRDGGKNWSNVTPPDLPKWTCVNSLEPDPHTDGGCYLACTGFRQGDYQPYLYYTSDYGKSWEKITQGIAPNHFTRVVRAHPTDQGLLFAGTEEGMYISFNNGKNWKPFQLNLPIVPITDLTIKQNSLVAATQGRSLWIIDDLSPIQQWRERPRLTGFQSTVQLLKPADAYRTKGGSSKGSKLNGENAPNGTDIHFYLPNAPGEKDTIVLTIMEADGDTIRVFSNQKLGSSPRYGNLSVKSGSNRFLWNMRYPDAEKFDGMVLWSYDLEGAKAVPGNYQVSLNVRGTSQEQTFRILKDPRSTATPEDFKAQFEFVQSVGDKLTAAHRAIREIRQVRAQVKEMKTMGGKSAEFAGVRSLAARIDSTMTAVEEAIYQTKNRSSQDPLNYPVRLNDKLANLMGVNVGDDFPPTRQSLEVRHTLFEQTDKQLAIWTKIKQTELPELNRLARSVQVDYIRVKQE